MRTYNSEEFLSKLSANNLPDPKEVVVVGMVKSIEESASVISFTRSLSCESWFSLPIEIVESFTHLTSIRCQEHEHPLVRVKFKGPDEVRQDLAFLLSLCSQLQSELQSSLSHAQRVARTPRTSRRYFRDASPLCYIVEIHGDLVCCCYTVNEEGGLEFGDCTGIV